jgi:hypothetical protein
MKPIVINSDNKIVFGHKEIEAIYKFEDMNFNYLQDQAKGLLIELSNEGGAFSLEYIHEKMENIARNLNEVIGSYQNRVQVPRLKQKFDEIYNKMV